MSKRNQSKRRAKAQGNVKTAKGGFESATAGIDPLLLECLGADNGGGQALAHSLLKRFGYAVQSGLLFAYGAGDIPVLLVAHTDTVHEVAPRRIYHDSVSRVVWSPDGLGADDRAGVYAMASILRAGLRPHVLFTDLEEVGGRGAEDAAELLPAPSVNLLVQIDRRGARDAVYYSCDNPAMEKYVTAQTGHKTAQGTFSDISVLMPKWGIGGVNLSAGYYNEHTTAEHLRLNELDATVRGVESILRHPPKERFAYRPCVQTLSFKRGSSSLLRDWPEYADWRDSLHGSASSSSSKDRRDDGHELILGQCDYCTEAATSWDSIDKTAVCEWCLAELRELRGDDHAAY
jgi:hypothetical protein